jgi:acetolactate synthase small subunit
MTNEKLAQAQVLRDKIEKIENKIARLHDSGFFVELHQSGSLSRGMALIATVGVGESCEHDLAPLATAFRDAVAAYYATKLKLLTDEFASL